MMDNEMFMVEVVMTVRDKHTYERLGSREFKVEGPFETISELEIGMSMDRLYAELMRVVFELLTDGDGEEDE